MTKAEGATRTYTCGACKREFKTRRSFYVCDRCAAITCKGCLGRGCEPVHRDKLNTYSHLVDSIPALRLAGFDMKKWRSPRD